MRSHLVLITEAELLASSPERVYMWLEARAAKNDRFETNIDEDVEQALVERGDPLIDIALARFAKFDRTAHALFSRARFINSHQAHERALRLAILSSESLHGLFSFQGIPAGLFDKDGIELQQWLSLADEIELVALFSNPKIGQSFLRDFLEGKEPWQALDDPRRLIAIRSLSNNKRMTERYSGDMDGYAEYSHDSVFFASWKLAETLPATKEWANALGMLLQATPHLSLHLENPLIVAQRWRPSHSDTDSEKEDVEIAKAGYLWGYASTRKALAQLASSSAELQSELLVSDDPAFRDAVYTSGSMSSEQILAAYERDKNLAVNSGQRNDQIWRSAESRKALHDISWKACEFNNNYMDSANAYNYWEAEKRKAHPEWFKYEDDAVDPTTAAATKADVQTLVEAAAGSDYLIRENMTMIAQLKAALDGVNERLGWVWWFSLGAVASSVLHRF